MKKILSLTLALLAAAGMQAGEKARYVFYFIGDGMGMGHVNAAETYNRDVLHNDRPLLMAGFPVAAQVRTYSANRPITDSAAAGTALSTGHKTKNGMVGMAPDTTAVYSISTDFMRAGYPVGICTTVAGDDATPASFYAHAAGRGEKATISAQAINSGVNFFGAPVFRGMTDGNGRPTDWVKRMEKEGGYTVVYDSDPYSGTGRRPSKMLMLSSRPDGDQAGYTIDSIPGALTARTLTQTCLDQLLYDVKTNGAPGFFMMMEGGNIDWAAHANDGGAVIKEVLNFQQAIEVAYRFYLQHPDETLIVVTADHDTGGLALGRADNGNPDVSLADFQRISKGRFTDWCSEQARSGEKLTWERMRKFMEENLGFWQGVPVTAEEERELKEAFEKTYGATHEADTKTLYETFSHFTIKVFDIFNRHLGTGFTTGSHTANFVPVYALGAGAELFSRNLNNTEIPGLILKAAGL